MFPSFRLAARPQLFSRGLKTSAPRFVAVGDSIPKATLFENSPGSAIDIGEETAKGKSIILGIPGAFSPACSNQIPAYIKNIRAFNEKGYTKLFVVTVNDAFVTKAFGDSLIQNQVGSDQIRFFADPKGDFVKELDLSFDASKFFGNARSKRFALLVEDGKVSKTFVEPDNVSVDVSDVSKVLDQA